MEANFKYVSIVVHLKEPKTEQELDEKVKEFLKDLPIEKYKVTRGTATEDF